ncbi:MAG: hypothetical protein LBR22_03760 [Desulfovibrio sp.]|nr:hypothetical protein [Desulfovibrio sp.]
MAFYTTKHIDRQGMLAEEPIATGDAVYDALLGGMAEHFSWEYELTPPKWTEDEKRFLTEPYYFAMEGLPKYWDEMRRESPLPYVRRNLFPGADPFSRPGKYTDMKLAGEPELFFARIRTKEPRVLIPACWKTIVKTFADEVQPLVEGEFAHVTERVPKRGTVPECYYLSMAINELKFRGGDSGWKTAMGLIDRMEMAFYDEVISCLRSPLSNDNTASKTTNAIVSDGWMRLKDVTDKLQTFLESELPDVARRCPRRPGVCVNDGLYFTAAIDGLKKLHGDTGNSIAMKFIDELESGGWRNITI